MRNKPIQSKSDLESLDRFERLRLTDVANTFSQVDSKPIAAPTDGPFTGNLQPSTINFYEARNKQLSDAEIEKYIDPRITGSARSEVFDILKAMPPAQRRNYAAYGPGNAVIANTWEDFVHLKKEQHPFQSLGGNRFQDESGRIFTGPPDTGCTDGCSTGVFRKINYTPGFSGVRG